MRPGTVDSGLRRAQWGWGFYAWANHGFATTVLAAFFPIFFGRYWAAHESGTRSTFFLTVAVSGSSFLVMLLAPWLGAIADQRAWKKPLLAVFTVIGIAGTTALAFVGE